MRDTLTWNELQTACEIQQLDEPLTSEILETVKSIQSLDGTEEVKLCRQLTLDDQGREVFSKDRRITGVLYDFNDTGNGDFYVVIDFKMYRFTPQSILILKKTYKGAETLVEE